MLKRSQRMLITSSRLKLEQFKPLCLVSFLEFCLQCTKTYRFVQYSTQKCFNNFIKSVIEARREGDQNPLLRFIAETMNFG